MRLQYFGGPIALSFEKGSDQHILSHGISPGNQVRSAKVTLGRNGPAVLFWSITVVLLLQSGAIENFQICVFWAHRARLKLFSGFSEFIWRRRPFIPMKIHWRLRSTSLLDNGHLQGPTLEVQNYHSKIILIVKFAGL